MTRGDESKYGVCKLLGDLMSDQPKWVRCVFACFVAGAILFVALKTEDKAPLTVKSGVEEVFKLAR